MIVCQRCSKENQDHYKFCLGCGAEISSGSAEGADIMKTMVADSSAITGKSPVSAPAPAPAGPPPGVGLPAISNPTQQPPVQRAVPFVNQLKCGQCQADIPPNFRFCGVCGTPIQAEPMPEAPPTLQTLQATMTLIRPDGTEGGVHALHEGLNKIGRNHGAIFESDGYLSPDHADLRINRSGVHRVEDCASLNGVFVRMTEEEELAPGQIIRIGQELLQFDLISEPLPVEDGTEVMGSPNPGYWGRITVIIGADVTGAAFPLLGKIIALGRENGDINFPDDGYVSGMHAQVVSRDGKAYLSDRGSSNGTFMKVSGGRDIQNNSYILLGQQLFRITVQ